MLAERLSRHVFYPLWDRKDRSCRLRHWRELEALQWQDREQLRERQWRELARTLEYAERHSPFYRRRLGQAGIRAADIRTPEDLRRVPITTKKDMRENLADMISDEHRRETLVRAKTGGSTGFALDLYFDETCQQRRNAAAMLVDGWAGWRPGMWTAALWGNPPVARTLRQKIRLVCLDRQVYLDTMALNAASMGDFVARWRELRPRALFGHAHSIYVFACWLRDQGITDLRPEAIVSTSMMLLDHERAVIEQVFGRKVTNRYGCEEVGLVACECERHEGMHLNTLHLYVEVVDDAGAPAPPGVPGRLLLTDFNNRGMPLVRYQVEDVGVTSDRSCPCGRGMPMLERIEGRVADFLRALDGTLVAGVSLVERTLTRIPGLMQMQLIQESAATVQVNRVRSPEYTPATDRELIDELRGSLGASMDIVIKDVPGLDQEANGKYRFSICKLR